MGTYIHHSDFKYLTQSHIHEYNYSTIIHTQVSELKYLI